MRATVFPLVHTLLVSVLIVKGRPCSSIWLNVLAPQGTGRTLVRAIEGGFQAGSDSIALPPSRSSLAKTHRAPRLARNIRPG